MINTIGAYISCEICGKKFVCYHSTWKYKRDYNKKRRYYCSYSCFRKGEPPVKKKSPEI